MSGWMARNYAIFLIKIELQKSRSEMKWDISLDFLFNFM